MVSNSGMSGHALRIGDVTGEITLRRLRGLVFRAWFNRGGIKVTGIVWNVVITLRVMHHAERDDYTPK